MHYQPRVKASHHAGDELPMGYKSGEKEGGENYKIRTASLGIKAELPRIQSEIMCYHMDVLRGWSLDLEDELNELVGSKSYGVLHNMQKVVILGTLNVSRSDV